MIRGFLSWTERFSDVILNANEISRFYFVSIRSRRLQPAHPEGCGYNNFRKKGQWNETMKAPLKKKSWNPLIILLAGIVFTAIAGYYTEHTRESQNEQEYALVCNEIKTKIATRLHAHAQLLRSGASFLSVSEGLGD